MNFLQYFQIFKEDFGVDPNLKYKPPEITTTSYKDTNYTRDQFQRDYIENKKYYVDPDEEEKSSSPSAKVSPSTSSSSSSPSSSSNKKDKESDEDPESCNRDIFNLECHRNLKILLWVLIGFSIFFTLVVIGWIIYAFLQPKNQPSYIPLRPLSYRSNPMYIPSESSNSSNSAFFSRLFSEPSKPKTVTNPEPVENIQKPKTPEDQPKQGFFQRMFARSDGSEGSEKTDGSEGSEKTEKTEELDVSENKKEAIEQQKTQKSFLEKLVGVEKPEQESNSKAKKPSN